jgi:2-dehydropantoate 2-reductase
MTTRSYAIIGTGALGGFYGAQLQHAGIETRFLLRSDYEHVRRHGLRCDSINGDFVLPEVHAYDDVRKMPRCDVVCVALKTTQNHLLPELLPGLVKDDGVVLVMQNGLGVEDEVARIVGADRVVGCLCFLCSNKVEPGHICHLDYGYVRLGEHTADGRAGGVTARLQAITSDFERAGIEAIAVEDLRAARWHKLVWNIPYNGLSVVLRATTDRLMAEPNARALVEALMHEVVTAAGACGRMIALGFVQKMLDHTLRMKPYKTSMMLDFEAGRAMEIEAIYGNPLRAAQAAGAAAPMLKMLYRQLKFLDSNRQNAITAQ